MHLEASMKMTPEELRWHRELMYLRAVGHSGQKHRTPKSEKEAKRHVRYVKHRARKWKKVAPKARP